jgi:uncharacterized protein (TIGR02271 family)
MAQETIVAVYDTAEHAQAARRALEKAGFPSSDISILNKDRLASGGREIRDAGIWQRLFGGEIREHEAEVYGRTVSGGGVVLSVRVPDTQVAHATGILDVHKPVDIPERASNLGVISSTAKAAGSIPTTPLAPRQSVTPVAQQAGKSDDEVVRLAEEHLEVGKRKIETGVARIRRFVTTKAVDAPVTLHEEHAEVMRRAISDPAFVADVDWSDKSIEVIETSEEPVVSKTARIAEEVVVSKAGSDRTETVHDTVRRQQVEVERGQKSASKPATPPKK